MYMFILLLYITFTVTFTEKSNVMYTLSYFCHQSTFELWNWTTDPSMIDHQWWNPWAIPIIIILVKSSQWCSTEVDCSQPLCPYHSNQIIYKLTVTKFRINSDLLPAPVISVKQSKSKEKMCNGRRHVPLCPVSANEKYI